MSYGAGDWFSQNWPAMVNANYPLPIANIATMRGLDTSDIRIVQIIGSYSNLPVPAPYSFFIRDDSDITTPDDGVNVIVGSTGKRWKRALDNFILPTQVGQAGKILSTNGVTTQWVDPIILDVTARFGIAPGNTPAANTTGMLAMRDFMVTAPQHNYELMLPYGTLQFTDAKWLHNVRSVRVKGGPTSLQNTLVSSSTTEKIPVWLNEIFLDNAGSIPGFGTEVNGYLINNTIRNDDHVTLSTLADAANFTVDTWCMVYGYNQSSSGYPPSIRYFEYRKIKSIVGAVLSFYELLTYKYRSDWIDLANDASQLFGKARCLPLFRPGFKMMEYCELENLNFLPSNGYVDNGISSSLGGSLFGGGCIDLVVNNCNIPGFFFPTVGKNTVIKKSTVRFTEIDKCIDKVVFQDCDVQELGNGPACNQLVVDGGRIIKPVTTLNAKNAVFQSVRMFVDGVAGQFISPAASIRQESLRISHCIFDEIDTRETNVVLPSQAGMTNVQVKLPPTFSATNDFYKNMVIHTLTGTGLNQVRSLTAYDGATQIATVSTAWVTQPDNTTGVKLDRVVPLVNSGSSFNVTVIAATAPNKITCVCIGLNDPTLRGLGIGSLMRSTTTAVQIKVTDIYYDGVNTVVEGTWKGGTPAAAEVFNVNICNKLIIEHPNFITSQFDYCNNTLGAPGDLAASGNNPLSYDEVQITAQGITPNRRIIPFLFFRDRTGNSAMRINVNAVVIGMEIFVKTAYAGAAATAAGIYSRPGSEGAAPYTQTINFKTAGSRRMDIASTSGALAGDTLQALTATFHRQLNITCNDDLSDAPPSGYVILDLAPTISI